MDHDRARTSDPGTGVDDAREHTRRALDERQDAGLRATVGRAHDHVPLLRERLAAHGVTPADVDRDALRTVPFTTKEDFRDAYPDGLFAVDRRELRRVHASSGTTGKPKVVAYTEGDLDRWARCVARVLAAAGVEPGETVQNAAGYGLFTGGLGFHDGVERLGACVVPTGAGDTRGQVEFLRDLGADALVTIPSYAVHLSETAAEMGVDLRSLPISSVLLGAEPSTRAMRDEVGERFGAVATENYGLSELMGPGVATECAHARDGMHCWEDHFYPEVVDPASGERLPEGETGELVVTPLGAEALPLVRYRTGDRATLERDGCACGREHARISIAGRVDDMLVVRGVNVYPTEVEAVLLEFDALAPHYRIDVHRDGSLDTLEITAERDPGTDPDAVDERAVADRLAGVLRLTPDDLRVVEPRGIDRSATGKARRVYDHR